MNPEIELIRIQKSFAENQVLKEVDLTIHSGEIFGLLGPSGAGKTTLIRIMTGRLLPDSGKAYLFGKESGTLTGRERRQIGMMMDDFGLYERLSCRDNLAVFASIYGVPARRVDEVLGEVKLWEARKRPASALSKGMKCRLSIARAVLAHPKLLFLDEPTAGLDPGTAAEIHGQIQRERERGTTVFLTTHNMEEAAKLCGHVALLNEGSIVEYGKPEEICRRYNHQHKIKIRFYNGEQKEFECDGSQADVIADYLRRGTVETIHSTEPDLETVFMERTGRGFMDLKPENWEE